MRSKGKKQGEEGLKGCRERGDQQSDEIIRVGKLGLDGFIVELGSMVVDAITDTEREKWSGPE